jgi:putative tryptophan/tyrosine transport system ATP-binding protein
MKPLLEVKHLHLRATNLEKPILQNIDLQLSQGDFLVILGSNGSGKSSLIKCINGLYTPTDGNIKFNGIDTTKQNVEKNARYMTTLTQDLNLTTFKDMTVFENCVCAALKNNHYPLKQEIADYLQAFHKVLPEKLQHPVSSLSGGQRQCLALAMCLYNQPNLLLLDEHTSALDPKTAKKMMTLTNDHIHKQKDLTVMMTTHNLDDAIQYGNRLIALKDGQIIFEASGLEKNELTKQRLLELYD